MDTKIRFKTIDDYISVYPKDVQKILKEMRKTIQEAAPEAEEVISYNMPAYKLHGILVYFAAHKEHIGFYALPTGNKAFIKELSHYKTGKGSMQLPFEKPLPVDLISRIVKFRVEENVKRQKAKEKSKRK